MFLTEYCAGSTNNIKDDIMECVPVARNVSGAVTVTNGKVELMAEGDAVSYNISEFQRLNDTEETSRSNNFNLEPGK